MITPLLSMSDQAVSSFNSSDDLKQRMHDATFTLHACWPSVSQSGRETLPEINHLLYSQTLPHQHHVMLGGMRRAARPKQPSCNGTWFMAVMRLVSSTCIPPLESQTHLA